MAFDWKTLIGPGLVAGSTLASGLLGKGEDIEQKPLETAEQTRARQQLYNLFQSDRGYKGPLGNYDMSGLETEGQNKLLELLKSGNPEMLNFANAELKKFYGDTYDPFSERSVYAPFKAGVERELRTNMDRLRQGQAIRGNLYSDRAIQEERELYDIGQEKLTGKLGELYDTMVGRRAALIPSVVNAAATGEEIAQKRIGASQIYGALPRTLADTKAKDAYSEFVRNQQGQERVLGAITGTPVQFGVNSIPTANPWQNLLSNLAMYGGMYAAAH